MIIPPKLNQGDRVAIVSPSGSITIDYLTNAVNIFESWGLKPYVSTHAAGSYRVYSGTSKERLTDLQMALDDPLCKAVFCSRGGYGAVHLLEKLNAVNFIQYPKWIVGFSDVTVLHAWANYHGVASLHADMPKTFPFSQEDTSLLSLKNYLFEEEISYIWDGNWSGNQTKLEGRIFGGNLSVLMGLNGSKYDQIPENGLLLIEDLNEELYHLDRIMYNLRLKGTFGKLKALMLGGFTDMKDGDPSFGQSIEDIITNATSNYGLPLIFNVPAGHKKPNVAIPFGVETTIEKAGNSIKMFT